MNPAAKSVMSMLMYKEERIIKECSSTTTVYWLAHIDNEETLSLSLSCNVGTAREPVILYKLFYYDKTTFVFFIPCICG